MKKKNFIRLLKALFVLMAMLPAVQTASALGQKELQELLDSPSAMTTRAGDGFKEIDLSDFTEPLTTTMYVRAQNVRFVNGTLTRSTNFTTNAPLISIQNGYTLEIDYSVRLCGSFIGKPLVDIEAGTFRMSGGGITDNTHSTSINLSGGVNSSCIINTGFEPPVVIHLAEISGGIDNPSGGFVYISNSEVEFVNTSNAINLWGGTIQDNVKLLNSTAKVNLETSLTNDLWITGYAKDQAIVTGYNGYNITNDDLAKIHISNTDYTLSLENNSVYVRAGSNRKIDDVEPGTLPDRIPEADRDIIEELTITGKLNGTDIRLIRAMACKKLKKLDISGCSIVEGGDNYLLHAQYPPSSKLKQADVYVSGTSTPLIVLNPGWSTNNDVIGSYMFAGLSTLESLILPNTVVTVENGAFMDCAKLSSITFGSQVCNIPYGFLFFGSNNISTLNFHSGNTSFTASNGVIYNKNQTVIVAVSPYKTGTFGVPAAIDSIKPYAFAGCMGITAVSFNGSPSRISEYAFCQSGLKSIDIPSTVKHIGKGAFLYCEQLSSVTFHENIENIGYGAFAYCRLTEVDLRDTKIEELGGDEHYYYTNCYPCPGYTYAVGVFEGTETITTVKLPPMIKKIGGKVFTSQLISNIYCQSIPPIIWYKYTHTNSSSKRYAVSDTFSDIYSTCRLHVPSNTVSYYKEATGWKEFYNIIGDQTPVADPNTITNEDDLQRRLDEIAEQNPTNPVEIKICTEGITLTKGIYAKGNCKAIISGGPISVTQGYNKNALFSVQYNAYLRFSNISFDLLNFRQRQSCFYVMERGILEIDGSVEYKNMSSNTVLGWGREQGFYVNAGKIILYGGDASGIEGNVISNCGVVEMSGDIFKYGINIYNYYMVSPVDIYLGTIRLLSAIPESSVWTINGNWDAYPLETPFIESTTNYTIQASDYWQMRFTGLGEVNSDCEGVIQYYDGTPHNIKLKEYHDLQCEIDKTENNSARIDCRGVDVGHDITIEERLQMELDGYCDDDAADNIAPIWMPGGCMFFEPTVPQVVFNDIIFDSYSNGHRIYVRTKVEYRRNVRARNFLVFTIVEKGGHLTWRNARTENVLYPIYNDGGAVDILGGNLTGTSYNLNDGVFGIWSDTNVNIIDNNAILNLGGSVTIKEIKQGPLGKIFLTSKLYNKWTIDLTGHLTSDYYDGQFIMEGGSGYVLTAADLALLDFRLPAGCSVSLDTAHNAIVLHIATFPLGDVNLDFAVDVADIAAIISMMAGSTGISSAYADVNGDGVVDVADISTIIDIMAGKISPTPANLKSVNLGLPSGTLWANMNIGATSPEDFGSYFAWGETDGKTSYGWDNYKWCNGSQTTMTKYCTTTEYGIIDGNKQLDLNDDAAHAAWGGNWRMPTSDDFIELLDNTTNEWTSQNGVTGRKFTGTNGNSIFLPAAGYYLGSNLANAKNMGCYWSSSLQESEPYSAGILYLAYNTADSDYAFYRYVGQTVRPVYKNSVPDDEGKYDDVIHPEKPFYHKDGEMPCVSVGQITANIEANEEALPGGATIIGVTTREPIEYFFIAVSGLPGYYIKYPETPSVINGEYVYRIPLLFPQNWDYDVIVKIGGQTKDGRKFACKDLNIRYHQAGTGAVQVSLTFDNAKDIDLHLYTPSGVHYYYGNKGGYITLDNGETAYVGLDVDSNAGCHIDNINCENITLPEQVLEEGTYRVYVNMYSNCNSSIATGWTCVATRGGKLISNQLSTYGNPASGVYPVGQSNGDMTEVIRFKVELSPMSRIMNHKKYVITPVPLDELGRMKLEEEKLRTNLPLSLPLR